MLRSRALQERAKQIKKDMERAKEAAINHLSDEDLETLSVLQAWNKPNPTQQAALNRFWVVFWTEYGG